MLVKYVDGRINFIDENDHFLGCEMDHQCCEDTNWEVRLGSELGELILSGSNEDVVDDETTLSGYYFPNDCFYGEAVLPDSQETDGEMRVNSVCFRAIHSDEEKEDIFITISNDHDGYYYHMWEFKRNESLLRIGAL